MERAYLKHELMRECNPRRATSLDCDLDSVVVATLKRVVVLCGRKSLRLEKSWRKVLVGLIGGRTFRVLAREGTCAPAVVLSQLVGKAS